MAFKMGQERAILRTSLVAQTVKASAYKVGDPGSIPGSGRASGEGNGNPLQYSCRENPMNGGAWQATVCGVAKSQTRLSNFTTRKGSLKFIIIATVELLYEL